VEVDGLLALQQLFVLLGLQLIHAVVARLVAAVGAVSALAKIGQQQLAATTECLAVLDELLKPLADRFFLLLEFFLVALILLVLVEALRGQELHERLVVLGVVQQTDGLLAITTCARVLGVVRTSAVCVCDHVPARPDS
jgi:uncharacterized membrane protein